MPLKKRARGIYEEKPGRFVVQVSRRTVVGRKNHYGSRSRRGTEVAALFYTLLETAKLCGVEPRDYLRSTVEAALRGEPVPLPMDRRPISTSA